MQSSRNLILPNNRSLSVTLLDKENIIITNRARVRIGQLLAFLFAIGTGITGAEGLGKAFPGLAFEVGAPFLFIASTFANYRMLNKEVIAVLNLGFVQFFKQDRNYLPKKKIAGLSLGLFLAFVMGLAFAALTREAIVNLPEHFPFMAGAGNWLEIPGAIFGFISLACTTSLMGKTMADMIKTERLSHRVKRRLKNMFLHKTQSEKVLVALGFTLLCGVSGFLVVLGQSDTLEACANSQRNLLLKIKSDLSEQNLKIANVFFTIFTRVGALLIQLPFMTKTLIRPLTSLFIKKHTPTLSEYEDDQPLPSPHKLNFILLICSILTAVGAGLIALAGKTLNAMNIMGASGGFLNTIASTFGNNLPAESLGEVDVEVGHSINTASIITRLGTPDLVPGDDRVKIQINTPLNRHDDKPDIVVVSETPMRDVSYSPPLTVLEQNGSYLPLPDDHLQDVSSSQPRQSI